MVHMTLTSTVQVSASSWGVSPVKNTYGSLQVLGQHIMVASYGLVNPTHAQTMTHVSTFNGRYDGLKQKLLVLPFCRMQHLACKSACECVLRPEGQQV